MISNLKYAAAPRVFAFVSAPIDTPPSLRSLANNQLCGINDRGGGTYTTEGITKLCVALLQGSAITSLKYATSTPPPLAFAFVSAPIDTPPALGSLGYNFLCRVKLHGGGIYTTEGITKLCEALKGSSVISLECAAAPKSVLLLCQHSVTLLCLLPPGSTATALVGTMTITASLLPPLRASLRCARGSREAL